MAIKFRPTRAFDLRSVGVRVPGWVRGFWRGARLTEATFRWRSDLKWGCGIAFAGALSLSLLLLNLYVMTGYERSLFALAVLAQEMELDKVVENSYEELTRAGAANPAQRVMVPNLPVEVTLLGQQVRELSKEELKVLAMREFSDGAYRRGLRGPAPLGNRSRELLSFAGFFSAVSGIFNEAVHRQLGGWLLVSVGVTLVLGAALVLSSRGWGKLISLGLALTVAGLGPFLAAAAFVLLGSRAAPQVQDGFLWSLLHLAVQLMRDPLQIYLGVFILGVVLFWGGIALSFLLERERGERPSLLEGEVVAGVPGRLGDPLGGRARYPEG